MALLKFVDTRVDPLIVDGYTYRTCTIGNQQWSAENLIIPMTGYSMNPVFYKNASTNSNGYGRYYNWEQAVALEAKLPHGWRIPTKDDFDELIDFCGGTPSVVMKKLRATTTWPNVNTDDYGFTLYASGGQYWENGYSGSFVNSSICSLLWSKTEQNSSIVYVFYNERGDKCGVYTWGKGPNSGKPECNRFNVRCVAMAKH